jgi:sugar phosphate isomerase/epimerase
MLIVGHSTGVFYKQPLSFREKIEKIAAVQRDCIEINIAKHSYLDEAVQLDFDLVKKFKYRSLHAPTDLSYPNAFTNGNYDKLLKVASNLRIHTLVFHPDTVDEYTVFMGYFAKRSFDIAFENSDKNKSWGQTVADMTEVFKFAPNAKFVLDINHMITNSQTSKDAAMFHQEFGDRLVHYHVSGYDSANIHCTLIEASKNQQDFVLGSVSQNVPIILEGFSGRMPSLVNKEYNFIKNYFKSDMPSQSGLQR